MITLCGFALSNYYLKVKFVLLEKGIPFEEERTGTGSVQDSVLAVSPLGKIPFLRTPQGGLCESQVICDYLEAAYPGKTLLPADPFAAAKVRELIAFIDLHLELVARELYAQAFFGGTVSEGTQARVRKLLTRHIAGFKRLAKFGPYVAGDSFTMADCAAWASLPLVARATKLVLGEDMLEAAGIDWRGYVKLIDARPVAAQLAAERKAEQAALSGKA